MAWLRLGKSKVRERHAPVQERPTVLYLDFHRSSALTGLVLLLQLPFGNVLQQGVPAY